MNENDDMLKLENQLCFPLYACSKEIIRRYKPYLDPLDLTYTQYITMMVMWEKKEIIVKDLGNFLYLDSGTMTPVLKKLEAKGYITRVRSPEDERSVSVTITEKGQKLKEDAAEIPLKLGACVKLAPQEAIQLHSLLYKLLSGMGTDAR
ncbi:MAG: MarR family transcriptional regulator [Clostridia bacterium]|nr:MarR family transcriptional regulator [Anaerotignum sp.]NCC15589.1 MarR family transcriptional regulator [Clostridia bacterium]